MELHWTDSPGTYKRKPPVILPAGVYHFTVNNAQLVHQPQTEWIQECDAVRLFLKVGSLIVLTQLHLENKFGVKLFTEFFESIGWPPDTPFSEALRSANKEGDCFIWPKPNHNGVVYNSVCAFITPDTDVDLWIWRAAVLERDGWKCVLCGSRDKVQAHHIVPASSDPSQKYNVDNGRALCKMHHERAHPWFTGHNF